MSVFRTAALALAALCFGTGLHAGPRIWRDTSGRSLKAEFLYADANMVFLKLDSGKTSEVALGLLSNDDLDFVQRWKQARKEQGISFEAPLRFEVYRSKKFSAAQAQNAGYFPLDTGNSDGVLRLEFRRYGEAPKGGGRPVLRIHTADPDHSGTSSTIVVSCRGVLVGSVTGAQQNSKVDIPISPTVLTDNPLIEFTVKCGPDDVLIQSRNTGKGPRLLVLENADK